MTSVEEAAALASRIGHETRSAALWDSVEALVDRSSSLTRLQAHRVHLFAARRWRSLGRSIPQSLHEQAWLANARVLAAPVVLARARQAYDGPMILYKGPAAGALYPDPALRPFGDLDLIVDDAEAAQRALLSAGFEEFGDPELFIDIHHLRALRLPGLPVYVEIHDRPKWPEGMPPPPKQDLLAEAVEAPLGVDGVLAPSPAHHAVLLAAHAWAHEPLLRLIDLVDVAAAAEAVDRDEIAQLARSWKVERIWLTTIAAADSLFRGSRPTWPLRLWARHLRAVRQRTVLESHLEHWLSTFWALPPRRAARMTFAYLSNEFRPAPGETWGAKLGRTRRAIGRAFVARAEHNSMLGEDATKRSRRRLR